MVYLSAGLAHWRSACMMFRGRKSAARRPVGRPLLIMAFTTRSSRPKITTALESGTDKLKPNHLKITIMDKTNQMHGESREQQTIRRAP